MGLCSLAAVVSFAVPFLAGFRSLFVELIAVGFVSVLIGSSLIWLGNHIWLLAICVVLSLVLVAYRYRDFLLGLFRLVKNTPTVRKCVARKQSLACDQTASPTSAPLP